MKCQGLRPGWAFHFTPASNYLVCAHLCQKCSNFSLMHIFTSILQSWRTFLLHLLKKPFQAGEMQFLCMSDGKCWILVFLEKNKKNNLKYGFLSNHCCHWRVDRNDTQHHNISINGTRNLLRQLFVQKLCGTETVGDVRLDNLITMRLAEGGGASLTAIMVLKRSLAFTVRKQGPHQTLHLPYSQKATPVHELDMCQLNNL